MKKIIEIGTKVEVNNILKGMIISATIRKQSITYEVQQMEEDAVRVFFAADWEITSDHSDESIMVKFIK